MDLQGFYAKVKQEEARIAEEFPLIFSEESASGGKAGVLTEVTKRVAARFITQGLARLASPDEAKAFREIQAEAKHAADQLIDQAKLSIAMLAMSGAERLKTALKPKEPAEPKE